MDTAGTSVAIPPSNRVEETRICTHAPPVLADRRRALAVAPGAPRVSAGVWTPPASRVRSPVPLARARACPGECRTGDPACVRAFGAPVAGTAPAGAAWAEDLASAVPVPSRSGVCPRRSRTRAAFPRHSSRFRVLAECVFLQLKLWNCFLISIYLSLLSDPTFVCVSLKYLFEIGFLKLYLEVHLLPFYYSDISCLH